MPDMPGRWMSINTTSGANGGSRVNASSAFAQAATHLCDQVNAIQELAEMLDESNRELLEAVRAVLHEALRTNGGPAAIHVADLRRILSDYEPLAWSSDAQCEFVAFARRLRGIRQTCRCRNGKSP